MEGFESYYSLDNSLLFYPLQSALAADTDDEKQDFQELYLHELCHWYQHHGTSAGCFISALKYACAHHIADSIRGLSTERRTELFQNRKAGQPVLPLFVDGEPNLELFEPGRGWPAHSTQAPAGEFFHYLANADFMFRCYSNVEKHLAPGLIFSRAILYTDALMAHRLKEYKRAGQITLEAVERDIQEEFSPLWLESLDRGRVAVDTQDLFETCSLLIEMTWLLYGWRHPDEIANPDGKMATLRILKSRYGTDMVGGWACTGRIEGLFDSYISPLKYASFVFDEPFFVVMAPDKPLWDFFSENLPTLMALLEIALNPPLPPRYRLSAERLKWKQLYPPIRYGLCLWAAKKVGKLRLTESTERADIIDYMRKVADAAGIHFGTPDNMDWAGDEMEDVFAPGVDLDDAALKRLYGGRDYFSFVSSCQAAFYRLQSNDRCATLTDLMLSLFRGEVPSLNVERIPAHGSGRYLRPPVIYDTVALEKRSTTNLWHREIMQWLPLKSAMDYLLFDLISGTGQPDFGIPLRRQERAILEDGVSKLCGMIPWV